MREVGGGGNGQYFVLMKRGSSLFICSTYNGLGCLTWMFAAYVWQGCLIHTLLWRKHNISYLYTEVNWWSFFCCRVSQMFSKLLIEIFAHTDILEHSLKLRGVFKATGLLHKIIQSTSKSGLWNWKSPYQTSTHLYNLVFITTKYN